MTVHKSNCRDASRRDASSMACPRGSLSARVGQRGRVFAVHPAHWLIYAQANTVFRKCALLWRDVIALSQSDVLYDSILAASLEILQRLDLRYDERMLEDEMRC